VRRRRSHAFAAREALRRGRVGWLLRASARALALRLGRPPAGPLFATLAVTYRCNYRCVFCDLPQRARGDPPLEVLVERLEALALRGVLAVGLTGGEPLLHPRLFEVIAAARRLRLLAHLNTNGSSLARARVEPVLSAGLHSINVSLDGARAETHDTLRGVPGSFEQIRATVRELLARRRGRGPRIGLVMVVGRGNHREVLPFARLARDWGADAAGFLPEHDFVGGTTTLPPGEAEELARDLERALAQVEIADNSPAYLSGIAPFLAGAPMPASCSAGRSHVAVDPEGRGYPCVPLMTLERGGVPLSQWNGRPHSPSPSDVEEVCRRCWWNCHRELDLSLGILQAPARLAPAPAPLASTCAPA
jgi:MoaA/NifB/PqqE/SkfB family radical SAM enzyme